MDANLLNADLVLEGGGVKGIGLVGAVRALHDRAYRFQRVAGTSAGAITGSLVAAGMPIEQLEAVMRALDYHRFEDRTVLDRLWLPGMLANVLLRKGLYKGDWLHDWVAGQLADCKVRTWGDLKIGDDPQSALPPERSYKLVVVVSDVSHNQMLRLPWDYGLLGVGPDQVDELPVADAVRASASIPFFFQPCVQRPKGQTVYLTDGGMLSNFPIDLFDRRDAQRPRWPTLGIKLSAKPDANAAAAASAIRNPIELAMALVATMLNAHDQMHLNDPSVIDRTVFVDTFDVKATDFGLGAEVRERLYHSGTQAGQDFLAGWDFDRYLATYWAAGQGEAALASGA